MPYRVYFQYKYRINRGYANDAYSIVVLLRVKPQYDYFGELPYVLLSKGRVLRFDEPLQRRVGFRKRWTMLLLFSVEQPPAPLLHCSPAPQRTYT